MARHRLVATDLDGTLLSSNGVATPATLNLLRRLRCQGVETVFVTARHASAVARLGIPGDIVREAVVCAGAGRYALSTRQVSHTRLLPPRTTAAIIARLQEALPGTAFGWVTPEPCADVTVEPGYLNDGRRTRLPEADAATLERPVLKLFARAPEGRADGFVKAVDRALDGLAFIAHSANGFVDLVCPGVSKLAALQELCAERGIAAQEVVAFGDTAADLPMLRWAGWGVAVANAEQTVREAADAVTGPCDEEGVADFLRAWFGLDR